MSAVPTSVLVLGAVLLPLLALLPGALRPVARRPVALRPVTDPGRVGAWATSASFVLAVVLGVRVLADGPLAVTAAENGPGAVLALRADRLGVVLLLLVLGVSAVVQSFAVRYLRGERQAGRFVAGAAVLTTASATLVTAATLQGMALAWTAAGASLVLLLATYPELAPARLGVRRTAAAFLVGDAALWAAVALVSARVGVVGLTDAGAWREVTVDQPLLAVVSTLVVLAALARSAQLPFGRWLPATLAAPTPVSALLHAGVVNAGGILLVRLSPVVGASAFANHLALAAGAATAVWATTVMVVKADVKGALAFSTAGQMGFMVMTCALGMYAAAVLHLIAHGMYKASLFLGSGNAVRRRTLHHQAPPARVPTRRAGLVAAALSALLPTAALLGSVALLPETAAPGAGVLLVFAWFTGARATWGWLRRATTPGRSAAALLGGSVLVLAYLATTHGISDLLQPSVGRAPEAASSWWLLPVVVVLVALSVLRQADPDGRLGGAHRAVHAIALASGSHGIRVRPSGSMRRAASRTAASWAPVRSQGARS